LQNLVGGHILEDKDMPASTLRITMSLYDNHTREMTIAPQCPWYEAQQSYGAPNVNWCEETICSVINEPANTWSNLGFIIVAILLITKYKETLVKHFGIVVLVMGLFSGIYHASNNYLTQHFDFFGMALMTSFLLAFNAKRVSRYAHYSFYTLFWFFSFMNMVILVILGIINVPIQSLLLINALPIIALDLYNGYKESSLKKYGFMAIAGVILILAQVSAQVDLKRIYCQPENIFLHGHVIWHILCAFGMYFIAKHIQVINRDRQ